MFCGKCGTNVPEGSGFCPACGNAVGGAAPQPAVSAAAPQPVVSAKLFNKKEYIANLASDKVKRFSKLTLLVTLAYILVMIAGYFYTLEVSFEKIPIIKTVAGEDVSEFEDIKDEADEWVDETEAALKENEDLSAKERRLVEKLIKSMRTFTKTISINGISRVVDKFDKIEKSDADIPEDVEEEIKDLKSDADQILCTIKAALLVCVLFAMLFTLLGGFCKVRGLVIFGLIFTLIETLAFCGILFALLAVAVSVVLIYLLGVINKEYKNYRKGLSVA